MKRKDKAQTFMEYALLMMVVVSAFCLMRVFFTRALQEKYRQSADVFAQGQQYEKGVTTITNITGSTQGD